eukprot:jgi/Undpi1/701/HiC_scaffold_10.g04165.m1
MTQSTPGRFAKKKGQTGVFLVGTLKAKRGQDSFGGHAKGFEAAAQWSGERLRASNGTASAPHLVCTEYSRGRETISRLEQFLSPEAVRPVAHSSAHGACFFVTASDAEARALSDNPEFGLLSISPFPSALKVAPGVLEHGDNRDQASQSSGGLATTHGQSIRMGNVEGLNLELSPGTLPAHSPQAGVFIAQLLSDLMSESIDLHSSNVWSDPAMENSEHLTTPGGALRRKEWSMAATLVHELSDSGRTTPGDICSWGSISVHHAANDLLLVSDLDHLLYIESGAMGSDEESMELRVACFMGLVSFLSGRLEVLRVSPRHEARVMNAAARTMIQSATLTRAPLTAAGLDGTGEVIQVIDTGVDETSCYFIDDDGQTVTHGHYFDEYVPETLTPTPSPAAETSPTPATLPPTSSLSSTARSQTSSLSSSVLPSNRALATSSSSSSTHSGFNFGGDFFFDPERRKIIQYIDLYKSVVLPGSHGTSSGTSGVNHFAEDDVDGHGTHVAGSAAGAMLTTPAETSTACSGTEVPGCVGGCVDLDRTSWGDDLLTLLPDDSRLDADLDSLCPMLGCDDTTDQRCLSDDVGQTLADHGGMAQGAKLAIFDVGGGEDFFFSHVGSDLWQPCLEAGCMIHSMSGGGDDVCAVNALDIEFDTFMHENPEHLLVFAAGNDGHVDDGRTVCTIYSPAIGKNALAVGATSSGQTRLTATGTDGDGTDDTNGYADVDTVAFFSSRGPTQDNRIKPEVMAPGDAIYSARGGGEDTGSCRLSAKIGTSMSTPIVSGAAAMVRQYFLDESFYLADVTARGWCNDGGPQCEAFSPSSATVKAMLINSANLMGGSSEPNGERGFGRIHLEKGMPLDGEGDLALFVADSAFLPELNSQEFYFDVDASAGLDFRATLSWIDPPASSSSVTQLVHDLDLVVESPSGTTHTMWANGVADSVNVNERVIIAAADVESGTWIVRVSTNRLLGESQNYSLVVNGAIVFSASEPFYSSLHSAAPTSSPTSVGVSASLSSAGSITSTPMSLVTILAGAVVSTIAAAGMA